MYIWIGCGLPESFSQALRQQCLTCGEHLELDFSGFSLPQHISLKISFDAGQTYPKILSFLHQLLQKQHSFFVQPQSAACHGNILWIPFNENETLCYLHALLDTELNAQFGIPQHVFDRNFCFHSTLCLGPKPSLQALSNMLKDFPLPVQLPVNHFLLGLSQTGENGTYRIIEQIDLT